MGQQIGRLARAFYPMIRAYPFRVRLPAAPPISYNQIGNALVLLPLPTNEGMGLSFHPNVTLQSRGLFPGWFFSHDIRADVYPRPWYYWISPTLAAANSSQWVGSLDTTLMAHTHHSIAPFTEGPRTSKWVGIFRVIISNMEIPDTENVSYMDEYPHIEQRLRLRRQAAARPLGFAAVYRFDPALRDQAELRSLMEQPPQDLH